MPPDTPHRDNIVAFPGAGPLWPGRRVHVRLSGLGETATVDAVLVAALKGAPAQPTAWPGGRCLVRFEETGAYAWLPGVRVHPRRRRRRILAADRRLAEAAVVRALGRVETPEGPDSTGGDAA